MEEFRDPPRHGYQPRGRRGRNQYNQEDNEDDYAHQPSAADNDDADIHVNTVALEDDNNDFKNTYESYRASKVQGRPHPDPIVETASLAGVSMPDTRWEPQDDDVRHLVQEGVISDAQAEVLYYANMRFRCPDKLPDGSTPGFFMGDGAGVGKGRTLAALILNHWKEGGKRILWVSCSNDLRVDALRDLGDLGTVASDIPLFPETVRTQLPSAPRAIGRDGICFVTYSLLISGFQAPPEYARQPFTTPVRVGGRNGPGDPTHVMAPTRSRLLQIIDWLSEHKHPPLIIFDEAHKAKNLINPDTPLKPTKTGLAVLMLQQALPSAHVVYSSATGASNPQHLGYMVRLGTHGFNNMVDMCNLLSESGLASLELFSRGLKSTGCYVSRSLSYTGTEFMIDEIELSPEKEIVYQRAARFWSMMVVLVTHLKEMALHPPEIDKKKKMIRTGTFYAAHQRFFRQMLMAAKVEDTARIAHEALAEGYSVVIGLQSTGEANMEAAMKEEGTDEVDELLSAPAACLRGWVKKHFPIKAFYTAENNKICEKLAVKVTRFMTEMFEQPSLVEAARLLRLQRAARNAGDNMDDVEVVQELTLEERLARDREAAVARGFMIDLSDVADEHVKESMAVLKEEYQAVTTGLGGGTSQQDAAPPSRPRRKAAERAAQLMNEVGGADQASDDEDGSPLYEPPALDDPANANTANTSSATVEIVEIDPAPLAAATAPPPRSAPRGIHGSGTSWADPVCLDDSDDEEGRQNALQGVRPPLSDVPINMPVPGAAATMQKVKTERSTAPASAVGAAQPPSTAARVKGERAPTAATNATARGTAATPSARAQGTSHYAIQRKAVVNPNDIDRESLQRGLLDAEYLHEHIEDGLDDGEERGLTVYQPLLYIKAMLLRAIDALELPANPLDDLIVSLGGPDKVAEMTGRKGGLIKEGDKYVYKDRKQLTNSRTSKDINVDQRAAFMNGIKRVAILSDAASTGTSLHADCRYPNTQRRVHITLELPWSADKAVQQMGRSHRSNQASAPIYRLLVTKVGGEYRFASSAAKRLQTMGALLRGDRRSVSFNMGSFDIDTPLGSRALHQLVYMALDGSCIDRLDPGLTVPVIPEEYLPANHAHVNDVLTFNAFLRHQLIMVGLIVRGTAGYDACEKPLSMARFLNRMLGMPVEVQQLIFEHFWQRFQAVVRRDRIRNKAAPGIVTLRADSAELVRSVKLHTDQYSGAVTRLVTVKLDMGMSFDNALDLYERTVMDQQTIYGGRDTPTTGFYYRHSNYVGCERLIMLLIEVPGMRNGVDAEHRAYKPYNQFAGFEKNVKAFDRVEDMNAARRAWDFWYSHTASRCMHGLTCKGFEDGICDTGMRFQYKQLVSGAVLPIWKQYNDMIRKNGWAKHDKRDEKLLPPTVLRVVLGGDDAVVGMEVPPKANYKDLETALADLVATHNQEIEIEFDQEGGMRMRAQGPRAMQPTLVTLGALRRGREDQVDEDGRPCKAPRSL